jgi:hypothetical protein
MNRQLVRTIKRSDDTVLQVLESDDLNNLYVNVADSVPISGINFDGLEETFRVSNSGYTLTKDVQSALAYSSTQIFGPWPDGAAQYTGYEYIYPIPTTHDIAQKYMVYVANPSPDTALTMSVRNEVEMFGDTVYGQIGANGTSGTITVPTASYTAFSATAWSSCFTSIGAALTDYSADLNDNVPPGTADVPFAFTAVNDALYFGNTSPFQRIRVNIGTAGVYSASGIWEYWNGSAWAAVPEVYDNTSATVDDGTKSFTRTGSRYVQWQIPNTWAAYDIAGSPTSQYWVRWRITDFTSITTTPSLIQGWYKRVGAANVHGYLIEGLWNGGDCKITLENATALTGLSGFPAEVYIKRL